MGGFWRACRAFPYGADRKIPLISSSKGPTGAPFYLGYSNFALFVIGETRQLFHSHIMNESISNIEKGPETILRFHDPASFSSSAAEVVEMPLLLSRQQMVALEAMAHRQGVTTGELVRRVLQRALRRPSA
jgi:hypothetical protein